MEATLNKMGPYLIDELKRQLSQHHATGQLESSLKYRIEIKNGEWTMIVSAAKQLEYVDRGRRPGLRQPPSEPIRKWIVSKHLQMTKGMSPKGLAFIIARSIGIKGIKPTHIIQSSLKEVLKNNVQLLETSSKEEINKLVKNIIFEENKII